MACLIRVQNANTHARLCSHARPHAHAYAYARTHARTHADAHTSTSARIHTQEQIPKIQNRWNNFSNVILPGENGPALELAGLDHIGAVTDMVHRTVQVAPGSRPPTKILLKNQLPLSDF